MRYAYYPGCSLHSTAEEYDISTRAVMKALGVELLELEDWSCCGATPAHSSDKFLGVALPMRNLFIAEETGLDVLAPCAACYNSLRHAQAAAEEGEGQEARRALEQILGREYRGDVQVLHPLELLGGDEMLEAVRQKVTRPLRGLKVATYYGCLLGRPAREVAFEDPERPVSMDRLMEAAGAEVVRWSYKTDCCGGSLAVARPDLVVELVAGIVRAALAAGAEAIVTACPLCQSNLDTRQAGAGERPVPVLYVTEALAWAMELPEASGLGRRHLVDPAPALAAVNSQRGMGEL